MKAITVVICTYDRYDLLTKSIESLYRQATNVADYNVLVVDNTPKQHRKSCDFLIKKYKSYGNFKIIFEDVPGLSNARNRALEAGNSKYIAYLDDDAIASSSWIDCLLKAFEFSGRVGVVGGQIQPIWAKRRPSWLGDQLLGYLSVVDWGGELRLAAADEWFAGANIAFSRELLKSCGGFSPGLGRVGNSSVLMSNEESQIIDFARQNNYELVYAPEAMVDHLVEEKRMTQSWFRRRVAWQAVSDFKLDATSAQADPRKKERNIKDFLISLPPLYRNLQGMYLDLDDPDEFVWQLSAIYSYTLLTLSGFEGLKNV
ncbi:glycosyltransferase family 2 protein [Halioxenophilus aromaticivorans]|uniref:Glycosyltransferase 2-like domain-containing protein n=1 Tax=Halioxenophilus aromaticivorans TaxID=1306992 RepID=A0AAV3U0F6_9ALTE